MNRLELFKELKSELSAMDFKTVLNYYGIQIQGNSILCPFHNDEHFGSCIISKDQKSAYCYVCEKKISSIDLVMHFENMRPMEAITFLWEKILGRRLPNCEDRDELISYKEARLIGLSHPTGYPKGVVNLIHYMDEEPEGYEKKRKDKDDDGYCPLLEQLPRISLYEMPVSVAVEIILGKTQEAIDSGYDYIRHLHSREFRSLIGYDLAYIKTQEIEMREKIDCLKKIRSRMLCIRKKVS